MIQARKTHLAAAVITAVGLFMAATHSVEATNPTYEQVRKGKDELAKGHVDNAIVILSKAAKTLGTAPGSCDCHYNLGKAFCTKAKKLSKAHPETAQTYKQAKKELRTAIRVGRGNVVSQQANVYLMANLPPEFLAPKTGDGTEEIAAQLGLSGGDRAIELGAPKAKVYEFYADWCEPCKQLKPVIAQVMTEYGDKLELKSFNVDDDSVQDVLDKYEVSPIPTIIFLSPDSKVLGYSIGYEDKKNIEKQVEKVLKPPG